MESKINKGTSVSIEIVGGLIIAAASLGFYANEVLGKEDYSSEMIEINKKLSLIEVWLENHTTRAHDDAVTIEQHKYDLEILSRDMIDKFEAMLDERGL